MTTNLHATLGELFDATADAIRTKTGKTSEIIADNFPSEISTIITFQEGTKESSNPITASTVLSGKVGYVNGTKITGNIPTKTSSNLTVSGAKVTVPAGYYANNAEKSVTTVTRANNTVNTQWEDYAYAETYGSVPWIQVYNDQGTGYVTGANKTSDIYVLAGANSNGAYEVKTVAGGATETWYTINKSTASASGKTVTVPAGYVPAQQTVDVATVGRANTTISSLKDPDANTIILTAVNDQGTGWVTGANKTASKVVSISASGATVTASDGTNSISKSVTTATQATPSVTINSSTGVVTGSATQTAGYVSAGTKSGTLQLSTQAATTITPGTSEKTAVAAGKYTLGTVKVAGDADLKAANIKKDVSIFGVTGTYDNSSTLGTFSAAPSTTSQTYIASGEGYDGFSEFTVEAMPAGAYSASHTLTAGAGSASATGNISLTAASAQPSSGYYIKATGSGTVSATGTATIGTAGYLAAGSKSSTSSSESSNTATQYYTVPTAAFEVSGNTVKTKSTGAGYVGASTTVGTISTTSRSAGDGSLTLTAGAGSAAATGTNFGLLGTATTTKPSSGSYLTVTGSGTVSGSGSGTVSTGTGYVTSGSTSSKTATGSKSSNTATVYYPITTSGAGNLSVSDATVTTAAGFYPSAVSKSVASGSYSASGGGLTAGAGSVSASGTNITLTEVSSEPSYGYYITAQGSGSVSRAAITKSASAGYVSTGSSTVSNKTSAKSNTATKYYTVATEQGSGSADKTGEATYYPEDGKLFSSFTVAPIPDDYIIPSGTKTITTNGTHDVTAYASAKVNVPVGVFPSGQKTITGTAAVDVTNYATAQVSDSDLVAGNIKKEIGRAHV